MQMIDIKVDTKIIQVHSKGQFSTEKIV